MAEQLEVDMLTLGPLEANCFFLVRGQDAVVDRPRRRVRRGHLRVWAAGSHAGRRARHSWALRPLWRSQAVARHFAVPVYIGTADAAALVDPGSSPLGGAAASSLSPASRGFLPASRSSTSRFLSRLSLRPGTRRVPTRSQSRSTCSAATWCFTGASGVPTCREAPPTSFSTRSRTWYAVSRPTPACTVGMARTPRSAASWR